MWWTFGYYRCFYQNVYQNLNRESEQFIYKSSMYTLIYWWLLILLLCISTPHLDDNILSIFRYLGSTLSYCTLIFDLMRNIPAGTWRWNNVENLVEIRSLCCSKLNYDVVPMCSARRDICVWCIHNVISFYYNAGGIIFNKPWQEVTLDLSSTAAFVVIEGVRGGTVESDIAIDDISITNGACPSGRPYQITLILSGKSYRVYLIWLQMKW